jgi:hypothetical protein
MGAGAGAGLGSSTPRSGRSSAQQSPVTPPRLLSLPLPGASPSPFDSPFLRPLQLGGLGTPPAHPKPQPQQQQAQPAAFSPLAAGMPISLEQERSMGLGVTLGQPAVLQRPISLKRKDPPAHSPDDAGRASPSKRSKPTPPHTPPATPPMCDPALCPLRCGCVSTLLSLVRRFFRPITPFAGAAAASPSLLEQKFLAL